MVDRLAAGAGRRTRPEHALLRLDLLVAEARVIDDAALRRPAQLVEDLPRTGEGESSLPAQRAGDILEDPPVLPGVAGRRDGLVDLDDAALRGAEDPLVLPVLRAGQDHVGEPGRLAEEEIDVGDELQLWQHSLD